MIIFFVVFSPKKKTAIIAEKIGVKEVRGATVLMFVESKAMYSRVSPIPNPINPLNRAKKSWVLVIFFLGDFFSDGNFESIASVGSRNSILPAVRTYGSLLFRIILNRTIPNPQHRTVPKLAITPIGSESDFCRSKALFAVNQTPTIIVSVPIETI